MFKKFLLLIFVCLIAFSAFVYYQLIEMDKWLSTPWNKGTEDVVVNIPAGSSVRGALAILIKEKLVKKTPFVRLVGKVGKKVDSVQKGEYVFSSSQSPIEMLQIMSQGKVKQYSFTIPEGFSVKDIALTLEQKGYAKSKDVLALAKDKEFLSSQGLNYLEGYLFPDTYKIPNGYSVRQILTMMIKNYRKNVTPEMIAKAREMGFKESDIPKIASVVEKESGSPKEYVIVSSVIHNRIKKGMMLQMDPTVIYGIKNFNGNLTRKDLRTDHPWNTYTRFGLPATPISNPGLGALKAAVNPAKTKYLYFVSMNNGSHKFTSTLKEHNKAVNKYQVRGHVGP